MAAETNIGPRPPGDPDGMRELAKRLRTEAANLTKYESLELSNWQSKNAERVRGELQTYARQIRMATHQIEDAARYLREAADRVEQEQFDWRARKALAEAKDSHIPENKI